MDTAASEQSSGDGEVGFGVGDEKTGSETGAFERYVMTLVRVLILVAFGFGFGLNLGQVVLDRFWSGRPWPLEYVVGGLGVAAAFYLFRTLAKLDWNDLLGRI